MAKVIELKCPGCGAALTFDGEQEQYYCSYCGTRLFVENSSYQKFVDEAQVRAVELEKEKFRQYRQDMEDFEVRHASWKKILYAWLGALGLFFTMIVAFPEDSVLSDIGAGLWLAVMIFGGIAVAVTKPSRHKLSVYEEKAMQTAESVGEISPYSWSACLLLCLILGIIGAHHFYARRYLMGLLYLFTGGLCSIGWFVDIVLLITHRYKDAQGRTVMNIN